MTSTAVITGMGVIAPTGLGAESHWSRTLAGRAAIGRISHFDAERYPSRLAARSPASIRANTASPAGCCRRPTT